MSKVETCYWIGFALGTISGLCLWWVQRKETAYWRLIAKDVLRSNGKVFFRVDDKADEKWIQ